MAIVAIWSLFMLQRSGSPEDINSWVKSYFDLARVPLFSGFLTLGSFMLTLQTAILQRLKEAYDSPNYLKKYLALKEEDPKAGYYDSLGRLSLALSFGILSAFTTAVLQMTIGFVKTEWACAICIGAAVTTLSVVSYLTIQILMAHREWFTKIEQLKKEDIKRLENEEIERLNKEEIERLKKEVIDKLK
jgi:hypothetical protein